MPRESSQVKYSLLSRLRVIATLRILGEMMEKGGSSHSEAEGGSQDP
jgi:hypothetical protein